MELGLGALGFDADWTQMRKKEFQEARDLAQAGYALTMDHRDDLDHKVFPLCTKSNKTVEDLQGKLVSDKLQQKMDRWSAKTQEEPNSFIPEFRDKDEVRERNQVFEWKKNYAQSDPSSYGKREGKEETREVRQLLKWTGSWFPREGVRRCPNPDGCNGRHCEAFWKPILKQEKRTTHLCDENCTFCHDPRHFPNDEWARLHVHRATAARRRAKGKSNKKKDVDAESTIADSTIAETTIADSSTLSTTDPGSSSSDGCSSPDLSSSYRKGARWADIDPDDLDENVLCTMCEEEVTEFQ